MTPDEKFHPSTEQPASDPDRYDIDRLEPMSPALPAWEMPDPYFATPEPAGLSSPAPLGSEPPGRYGATSQTLTNTVNVSVGGPVIVAPPTASTSTIVRGLWFVFIGWWLSGVAIIVAYALIFTIIGMPLGFALINKIPQLATLRPRGQVLSVTTQNGVTTMAYEHQEQYPLWLRAIYFVAIGWWAGMLWLSTAWALQFLIVTIPVSVVMYDRAPAVITLHKH